MYIHLNFLDWNSNRRRWLPSQNIDSIRLCPLGVVVNQTLVIPQIVKSHTFEVALAAVERKPVRGFQALIKNVFSFNNVKGDWRFRFHRDNVWVFSVGKEGLSLVAMQGFWGRRVY